MQLYGRERGRERERPTDREREREREIDWFIDETSEQKYGFQKLFLRLIQIHGNCISIK